MPSQIQLVIMGQLQHYSIFSWQR